MAHFLLNQVSCPFRDGRWKRWLVMLTDALCVLFAVFSAYWLRFEGQDLPGGTLPERVALGLSVGAYIAFLAQFKLYASAWRYASIETLRAVLQATLLGTVSLMTIHWLIAGMTVPRSVVILIWTNSLLLLGGSRIGLRLLSERTQHRRRLVSHGKRRELPRRRLLIVGAGEVGATILRKINEHPELGYETVGFVDDDIAKHGTYILGCRVIAGCAELPVIVEELEVDEVLLAIPSAGGDTVRSVVEVCEAADVKAKIVPSLIELMNGNVEWRHIRDVRVEDLLRREPVTVNLEEIAAYLRDKRVMVTGGGGSIGSELSRQVASWGPASLVVLDIDETAVFTIDATLREEHPDLNLTPVIADVRDEDSMRRHLDMHRPEIVFHAAAYKHVPLMESHPEEAIRTNVIGTRILARIARESCVERFILISTDKAVNPTSVMGATKRVAEMVLQVESARHQRDNGAAEPTKFMAVRFGNVLASRGSVLPVFQRQIAQGGPVTVTHPDMKRYFMTIPEAVQLVIQAGALGKGGEVFVLDMGEPVRILDLAKDLIRLSGYEPERDISIAFTGLRPGEKLFEELLTPEERLSLSRHERIFVCPFLNGDENLGADPLLDSDNGRCGSVELLLDQLEAAILTHSTNPEKCIADLEQLVPPYKAARQSSPVCSSDASSISPSPSHSGTEMLHAPTT